MSVRRKARMNYFEILGISPAATDAEIRQAYLNRIAEMEYGEQDTGVKDRHTAELRKAYDTLANQTSRDIYYNLLYKERRQKEKSGLEREAAKGFGIPWLITTLLGFGFLWTASWLFCTVVMSFNKGTAFWIQADLPYIVSVSRESDPTDFWVSFSILALLGLFFMRVSFGILRRLFRRLSRDS